MGNDELQELDDYWKWLYGTDDGQEYYEECQRIIKGGSEDE